MTKWAALAVALGALAVVGCDDAAVRTAGDAGRGAAHAAGGRPSQRPAEMKITKETADRLLVVGRSAVRSSGIGVNSDKA